MGSSHPWGVSRGVGPGTDGRVSEHKREFPPTGGVPAHGVCQEGWERDFPPTGGVRAHGKKGGKGISHPRGVSSQKKSPNRCGTVGAFFRLSFSVIGVT